jgi:transcriptional regulator of acetoin/glycerol metabolism
MTKLEITKKVQILLSKYVHEDVAKKIGVSRNTMYKRIVLHNWKKTEITHIESLKL